MANMYEYIENKGILLPDTATLKKEVEAEFTEIFGNEISLEPETPQGRLIEVETQARDSVLRAISCVANQINPNIAGGIFLDAIAALTGLERGSGEPSMVTATLKGIPSTIIPAGAKAATKIGAVFISQKAVVLDESGRGEVLFFSEEKDAVPCPAGGLKKIVSTTLGWESITNASPATLGKKEENDLSFRRLRNRTLFLQGVSLSGAIISGLYAVLGVKSVVFRENVTSEPKEIDGKLLKPHSIYVCVDGGTNEEVAQVLFAKKSAGCDYNGSVSVQVTCPESKQPFAVLFDRPEPVPVRALVRVKNTGSGTANVEKSCRAAICSYADGTLYGDEYISAQSEEKLLALEGFTTGTGVSPFALAAAVSFHSPALFVVDIQVGRLENDLSALKPELLPLAIWQKATITEASIEVRGV